MKGNTVMRAVIVLGAGLAILGLAAGPAGADLTHLWKLDGNAVDSVGGYALLTEYGAPTYVTGVFGQAVSLDGVSQYLAQSGAADPFEADNLSFTMWVQHNGLPTGTAYPGGTQDCVLYWVTSAKLPQFVSYRTPATSTVGALPTDGTWVFLAGTLSSAEGAQGIKLYANGVLAGTAAYTAPQNRTHFAIGGRSDRNPITYKELFGGLIDDVAVFNHVLSPLEMLNVMELGAENYAGPRPIYWDLNGTDANSGSSAPAGTWNAVDPNWNPLADGTGETAAWTPGQTAVFAAGDDATGSYTVTVDGTQDIGGLRFENGTVTLSGGTALRMVGTSAMNVASGQIATIATPISDDANSRKLFKVGEGTLVLSGACSYTGTTTILEGTLRLGASDVLPDASAVTVSGAGVLDLAGNSDTIGGLTLGRSAAASGAAVTTGTGTLTLDGNAAYDSTPNPLGATISGKLDLGSATRTFDIGDSAPADDDLTVSANISGTGVGLTKAGAGTMVLSGTNTYDGNTTIAAGLLRPAAAAALPNYGSPGKVDFEGGTLAVRVGGSDWATGDVDTLLANATKTSGAIGLDTTNGDLTQWTALTPTNLGTLGLTKLGANRLTLDRANDYTGPTAVMAGTLRLTDPNAIASSSSLSLANGTTLELRSDTAATFNTPGNGTTSFANLVDHPNATVTVDVSSNGSGTGNELTLSGGIGIDAQSGGTSTINFTSGDGYVLRTPVTVTRPNNATSTLVLNPTTASVIITTLTHGFFAGGGLYLTLGGTSTGNEVTTAPDTDWLYITKSGSSTWTWSADNSKTLGSCVISGGNLIVTGTLWPQGADTRSVQVNTGGTLHYNNPGAVDTSGATNRYLVVNNGSLDNTSGAAITTSTYDPRMYWKGTVNFIGSGGAASDLNLGAGAVTINGNRTVNIQHPDTTLTVGGVIAGTNAAYGLTKAGPGTLELNGVNTYTGATNVNAGTLGGKGRIAGTVAVKANAALAPGSIVDENGPAGTLTIGTVAAPTSLTMNADSLYEWELSNTAADKVVIYGNLDLTTGWKIKLIDAGGTPTGEYDLFTYTGSFTGDINAVIDPDGDWTTATISQDTTPGAGRIFLSLGVPGDTNNDGVVDAADFITVKQNFGKSVGSAGASAGDFDKTGTVDWADLSTLMTNMGAGGPAPATAPEPATLGLLMVGALAGLRRRRF